MGKSKRSIRSTIYAMKLANQMAWRANKAAFVLYFVVTVAMAGETYISLSFTEYIVNAANDLASQSVSFRQVMTTILFYTVAIVFFALLAYSQNLIMNRLLLDLSYIFNKELNEKLSNIEWEYYENHDTFLKIHEVRGNTLSKIESLVKDTMQYLFCIPTIIVYVYYLAQIQIFAVFLYIILVIMFNLMIAGKMFAQLGKLWKRVQSFTQKQNYYFSICGDEITHQEYKFLRLFPYASGLWEKFYNEEYRMKLKIFKKHEITLQTARLIFNLPYIFMMVFIGYEIMLGRHEIGFLIMANNLLNRIIDTCLSLQQRMINDRVSSDFIYTWQDVLAFQESRRDSGNALFEQITFHDVGYLYPQAEMYALRQLNLTIKRGEKLAIVGVNGSGKTTFTNILMGLTSRYEGGFDRGCTPVDIRDRISCIIQDFAQYQMSIKENISCGDPTRTFTDEQIWHLLDLVGLKQEILNLPDGLDTQLGQLEEGIELSKGQWQRVAIARLLAKERAEIWVLDEPTAYLDPISEIEIYNLIYILSENKTVLFISHRLGFAKRADRILVFENGSIRESGTHQELISQEGVYFELYKTQEKWYS